MSLAEKAVLGPPSPANHPGEEGYADWVIFAVEGLKEYPGHPYPKLMDVIREMPRVTKSFGLTPEPVQHFSTECTRKQPIPMKQCRTTPDQSVELYDHDYVQEIDITGVDRVQTSQHYAKRTDYTFEAVKTTCLSIVKPV